MNKDDLIERVRQHPAYDQLKLLFGRDVIASTSVKGFAGSQKHFLQQPFQREFICRPFVFIIPEKEDAAYFLNDLNV
ncbi:MAG: hypothetical protein R2850_00625 [Bacteroidia bacterium]